MNPARQTTSGRAAATRSRRARSNDRRSGWSAGRTTACVDAGPAGPFQPVGAGAVGEDQDDGHPRGGLGGRVQQRLEVRAVAGHQHDHPLDVGHGLPGSRLVLGTADAAIGGPLRQPSGGGA